jgi:Right handed beta helix region
MGFADINSLPTFATATILYPHTLCQGAGTQTNPWTNSDGTAGIQTCINQLAAGRGGKIRIAAGRYNITTPISITTHSVTIESEAAGFNNDVSGGDFVGLYGSLLYCSGSGIVMSGAAKLANLTFRGLYLFGPGESGNSAIGISATCELDNVLIERCNVESFGSGGIILTGGSDAGRVVGCSVLYCGTGIAFGGANGGYNSLLGGTVADNAGIGVIVNDTYGGAVIANNIIGRNANGLGTPVASGCNVYLAGPGCVLSGNQIYDAGDDIYFGHGIVAAHNVIVLASGCVVSGNAIYGAQDGYGIEIGATVAGIVISANTWTGGGSGAEGANSSGAVSVISGATGIAIDNPQLLQTPALLNSWANLGSGFAPAAYWIDSTGIVHLDGVVESGTPGSASVIFVLPAGYRPTTTKVFAAANSNTGTSTTPAETLIFIFANGNVTAEAGVAWLSLSGVNFLAGS